MVCCRMRAVFLPTGDNLAVHHALARARPGDVLVVHCEGGVAHGFWGEITTTAARARGVAGLHGLHKAGLRYPIMPFGPQAEPAEGMAKSYAGKS